MTLSVFATITPKAKHFSEAIAALESIMIATRAEKGCHQFELHESAELGQLHLYEVWADQAAFDAHHALPYTQAVFKQYETWLAMPVEVIFMRPIS